MNPIVYGAICGALIGVAPFWVGYLATGVFLKWRNKETK